MKTKQKQVRILAVFALLGISLFAAPSSYADLNTGLVAYYSFDDCTANDNSGRGHRGVANGSPLCVAGAKGKAFNFNGIDNYISVNDSLDLRATNKIISISLLMKSTSDNQVAAVIRKGISCGIPGWSMDFVTNSSVTPVRFLAWNNLVNSWAWDVNSTKNITQDIWHHVVMIANGTTATTYVDGKVVGESTINTAANIDTDSPMFIGAAPPGRCPQGVDVFYKGNIDEVRIYNRPLTAAEVTTLYNQSNPIQGTAPWNTGHTVTCQNVTQNTSVVIPKTTAAAWDCEKAGLRVKSGDRVKVLIDGTKY